MSVSKDVLTSLGTPNRNHNFRCGQFPWGPAKSDFQYRNFANGSCIGHLSFVILIS
ncbi:hypothetical protein RHIZ404_220710 [Rhizobium sp. EC-SD404]|nr:hypothetical protein RHIZ404_220710 [Rhizobium sp. EC-SD404]